MHTSAIKRISRIVSLIVVAVCVASCSSSASKVANTADTASLTTSGGDGAVTTVVDSTATTAVEVTTTVAPTATVAPATTVAVGTLTPADNTPTGWVAGAQPGDPVVVAAAGECDPFYTALAAGPYTQSRCGVWNANGGQRTWTVTRGAAGFLLGIIWQQTAPNTWVPVVRALETTAGQWSDITIDTANFDSGPGDELVSGTRIAGASGKLAVVIIDIRASNPRVVAVHPTGNHGVARLMPVGVEMWSAVQGDAIPKCCPLEFVHSFLEVIDGDWFVETRETVPTGDSSIPTSDF